MSSVAFDVLFANGVFRPVEPGSLPEGSRAKAAATAEDVAVVKRPGVCGGRACIAGTRITVWGIVRYWQLGLVDDAILEATPGLVREHLDAALRYATEHPEEISQDLADNQE